MDSDNGKKFMGQTEEAIKDIREDIRKIDCKLDGMIVKLDLNTRELRDWCIAHDKLNVTDLAILRSDLDKVKENKSGTSKIMVAVISGISGILGAGLGVTGLLLIKFIEQVVK